MAQRLRVPRQVVVLALLLVAGGAIPQVRPACVDCDSAVGLLVGAVGLVTGPLVLGSSLLADRLQRAEVGSGRRRLGHVLGVVAWLLVLPSLAVLVVVVAFP